MIFEKIFTKDNLLFMLNGAKMSLFVAALSFVFGTILGTIGAACRISKNKFLNFIGKVYVDIIRGTPMLLQILFLSLGLPLIYKTIFGTVLRMNPYVTGIIAISVNSGAYTTELIRSAIQAIDKGQWEACQILGLNYKQTMFKVILPQAFKNIVPPLVSELITLVKDSCLISTIGATELLYSAQILGANYYNYIVPLLLASLMYLIITYVISFLSNKLEKRLAVND